MALLVFFAAPAGTWIVPSHLRPAIRNRLGGRGAIRSGELQFLKFTLVLLLYIARHVLHGALGGQALKWPNRARRKALLKAMAAGRA